MIAVSLLAFLRTGTLCAVHLGLTREQVQQLLGTPDAVGGTSRKYGTPAIWKYGDVELYYAQEADRLVTIFLHNFTTPSGGAAIDLDPWALRGGQPLEEVAHALEEEGITYTQQAWCGAQNGCELVTSGGVAIGFIGEQELYGPPAGLHHLSRTDRW